MLSNSERMMLRRKEGVRGSTDQKRAKSHFKLLGTARAAVVHLNFRVGSNFSVPVCTVSPGYWENKADTQ